MRLPFLLTLTAFLLLTACCPGSSAPSPTPTLPAIREQEGLRFSLTTDLHDYFLGNKVSFTYRLSNTTKENRLLGQVPNCNYCIDQVRILRAGEEIWRSCRVIPPCGQKDLSLTPGETREYVTEWWMVNDHGTIETEDDTPIPPDLYTAIAELQVDNLAHHLPVSIQIIIQ